MRYILAAAVVVVAIMFALPALIPAPSPDDHIPGGDPGTNPGTDPGTDPGTEPAGDPWEGKETEIRTKTFHRGTTGSMSNGLTIWFTGDWEVNLPVGLRKARILSIEGSFEVYPAEGHQVEFAAINIYDMSRPLMQQCVAFQYWNGSELTSPINFSWSWEELYQGDHDMYPPPQPWDTLEYPPFCDQFLLRLWGPSLGEPTYGPFPREWHMTVTYEVIA